MSKKQLGKVGRSKSGYPIDPLDLMLSDLERRIVLIPPYSISGSQLAGQFSQTTKTYNYTAGDEMVILCDASSNNIAITLPTASTNASKVYYIKKIDTSSHIVTIKGNVPSETVDNEEEYKIAVPYTCITVLCDGSDWWII